jgi:hypothetical protein
VTYVKNVQRLHNILFSASACIMNKIPTYISIRTHACLQETADRGKMSLLLLHCCLRTACTSRPEAGMRGRATPPPSTTSTSPPSSFATTPPPIFATTPPPHSAAAAPPPSPSHRSWGWILCRIQIRLKNRMKDVRWALESLGHRYTTNKK